MNELKFIQLKKDNEDLFNMEKERYGSHLSMK